MTDLLNRAFRANDLPSSRQDAVARLLLELLEDTAIIPLSPEERDAVARSRAAAPRGDFATDEEVSALWNKHGV